MPDIRLSGELDNFERPNENPAQPPWYWQPGSDLAVIINNGVLRSPQVPVASALDYWSGTPEGIKAPAEVWGNGAGSAAIGSSWRIGLYTFHTVATSAPDGYQVLLGTGVSGGFLVLRRYDGGGFTTLVNQSPPVFGNGRVLLYRLDASSGTGIHEVWSSQDAGANWTLQFSHSEVGAHAGPYQFVLGGTDVLVGWESFGGGTIRRTQIYRYVSN